MPERIIREFAKDIEKGDQATTDKLKEYIEHYPEIPQFKNLLEKAYASAGKTDEPPSFNHREVE